MTHLQDLHEKIRIRDPVVFRFALKHSKPKPKGNRSLNTTLLGSPSVHFCNAVHLGRGRRAITH